MNTADLFEIEKQLRETREEERDVEIAKEVEEHKLHVTRVQRGARLKKAARPRLDFLAIGDSWFKYPLDGNILLPPFDFGITAKSQLQSMGNPRPLILSQAWPGQASTAVLSYKRQQDIIDVLEDGSQWINGRGPDGILISAGGDDIAGDQLAIYLEYGGGMTTSSSRFQGVLELVKASYADLFDLRNRFAPGVPIFGHCYDYALPNGARASILGPWLQPSFDFALYDPGDATQVVKHMIDELHDMLNGLAAVKKHNFHLVDTRNIIAPNNIYPKGWANELHPYTPGFTLLAKKFLDALKNYFPPGSI